MSMHAPARDEMAAVGYSRRSYDRPLKEAHVEAQAETILVVDDDPYLQEALQDRLEALGYRVLSAADGKAALEVVEHGAPQVVLLDIEMPGMSGLEVLKEIRRREISLPVIMVTAYGSIDLAVQAMKDGADDFITKPFDPGHVALVVKKVIEQQMLRSEVTVLSEELDKRHRLITGKSEKMVHAIAAAKKASASKSTVLLLGESGTGKELFARAIHNWSERKDRPFVPINCVGLSRELLENELFGHEKGAYTGADQLKRGKLELAYGGTVFLDEIGDISQELQTKLLRFLQEREFDRVGGSEPIRVDVRIIAATNRHLEEAIQAGRFRQDLYYRLNVVAIRLPPLRERKEDIPDLARFFAVRFCHEAKKAGAEISREAMEKLVAYDWPGNVRELANVIERAVVLGHSPTIGVRDLTPGILAAESKGPSAPIAYHEAIDRQRREVILQALAQTAGNRSAAARLLGLERSYMLKLMKSLGIN